MIPPFLATLGGKIATGVISAAVIAGAIYAYNARQQAIGYNEATTEFHEQIQEQAERVQVYEEKQDDGRIAGLEKMLAEKDQFNAAMLKENRKLKTTLATIAAKPPEVIREFINIESTPAPPAPCLVPDELVDRVDDLARVLNDVSHDRVPGDQGTIEEPASPGLPPVACAALVARIETLTSRLGNVTIAHRALSEQAIRQYEDYQAFKRGEVGGK